MTREQNTFSKYDWFSAEFSYDSNEVMCVITDDICHPLVEFKGIGSDPAQAFREALVEYQRRHKKK